MSVTVCISLHVILFLFPTDLETDGFNIMVYMDI